MPHGELRVFIVLQQHVLLLPQGKSKCINCCINGSAFDSFHKWAQTWLKFNAAFIFIAFILLYPSAKRKYLWTLVVLGQTLDCIRNKSAVLD